MNKKFSNEQIREIAENVDIGYICFINADTSEMVVMLNDEALSNYGISWEDEKEGEPDDSWPKWQKEMYAEIKADKEKVDSWQHVIRIEKPNPYEMFGFMERFVDEIIPEGVLKENFLKALTRSHPFRNFSAIIHNCEYREDWFVFKQEALEEYVRDAIGDFEEGE